jgi:ACS family hexuronate transporter-like MFS transporter
MDSAPFSQKTRTPEESKAASTSFGLLVGRYRWVICGLLLLGTTKNYMDRQIIGLLKPTLQHELGWSEIDYGHLVSIFQAAYGIGMLVMGRLIDWLGTRVGYAIAMVVWSLASMAQGMLGSFGGFLGARFALGFGESAVFPASLKAVAEWFPKKERALATGIFNAGTNVGAAITPFVVAMIVARWNWRWAFFLIGGLGFAWLILWFLIYRRPEEHPRCSVGELKYIRSDPVEPPGKVRWLRLLPHRQTWAYGIGKLIIDPIWWFYLFWIPDFLLKRYGLDLQHVSLQILIIYVFADAGSVAGGWLSSTLIHRGHTHNMARKTAMLVCAVCVVPIVFTPHARSAWVAVLLLGLATAAHQGFSANLFTLPSDTFPRRAVASVVGIGGTMGALGGMFSAEIVGYLLQLTGSYVIPFVAAGCAYLFALAIIHLLSPRLEMAHLDVG